MSIELISVSCPSPELIPSMRSLWKEAFGDVDEALDAFFVTAFAPERCRVFADGNEVLGALYIFDCELKNKKIAYIYAVATKKSARGQGIAKNLLDDTHRYLARKGYAGAILVPGEPSLFAFYEKLGYEICSQIGELETAASNTEIYVKKIEKAEYMSKRREYLPENGVVQENCNVDFLATYASFYKGDNFLLAAYKSDTKLRGVELLGDTDNAPAILRALGCEKGFFRVPLQNSPTVKLRPFAMYCPFDKTAPAPEYFGIAFD